MISKEYFGDLYPTESWTFLKENKSSALIDVRTTAEWAFVGVPSLNIIGKELIQVQWQQFPSMAINANFVNEVSTKISDKNTPLLFICRSGGRSRMAAIAMTEAGYKKCYNIIEGFEGDLDTNGHRSKIGGWKFNNLPWGQS